MNVQDTLPKEIQGKLNIYFDPIINSYHTSFYSSKNERLIGYLFSDLPHIKMIAVEVEKFINGKRYNCYTKISYSLVTDTDLAIDFIVSETNNSLNKAYLSNNQN
jgi:hypothetical protein